MKKKNSYWEERLIKEADIRTKEEAFIQKKINKIYDNTNRKVNDEIDSFLGRYSYGKSFDKKDVRKAIDSFEIKRFSSKAKEYVENKDFSDMANKRLKLYNLTMKTNRLEYLKAMINLEMVNGFNEEEKLTKSLLNTYALNKFKEQAGILEFTIPEPKVLNAKIKAIRDIPYKGDLWSKRIWNRQELLSKQVENIAQDLVLLGRNPTIYVNEIKRMFDINSYEARRLVVTEGARIQTQVTKYNYEQYGIEKYKYLSESGACVKCLDLHTRVFKVENMNPGENAAPMHPHCHCTEAPISDREDWEKEQDLLDKELDETIEMGYNVGDKNKIVPLTDKELEYKDPYKNILEQEGYKKWVNGLTQKEKNAIYDYTSSNNNYELYNGYLRGVIKEIPEEIKENINYLKDAISRYEAEETFTVYRGTYSRFGVEKLHIGDEFILDEGFSSTSFAVSITDDFIGGDGSVIYRIRVPEGKKAGAYIDKFSSNMGEEEFLVSPKTKFKLLKIDSKEISDGVQWVYDLEVV